MSSDVVEILRQLVAIPSVNPMGRPLEGPTYCESALTDHLDRLLQGLGLATWRQPVSPGRENLVARLEGHISPERGGPLIVWDAHQDTVPVDNMTIDPWKPEIRDGRLYGRGSCDIKGGMAAMIAALARLAEEPQHARPTIVLTCTVDEEYQFLGIDALASKGLSDPNGLIGRRPDAAIIAEPTGLDVIVAHKGVVRWQCHTSGRAAHSSAPDAGENAIYPMARIVAALEHYQRHVVAGLASHPKLGECTFNVGIVRGGSSINIVPDRCTIEAEVRFPPGVSPDRARQHMIDYLAGLPDLNASPQHDPPYMQGRAMPDDANGPLADRLAQVSREVSGAGQLRTVPYGTNGSFFAAAGIPSVVFGPGSIEQAHTKDEWIAIDQLHLAVEILVRFAKDWG